MQLFANFTGADLEGRFMALKAPQVDAVQLNTKARFPALRTQRKVLRKQRIVQNTPLIWRKPYHVTNSSHVIGHFLLTFRCSLRSLRYVRYLRCVVCVRLETAVKDRPIDSLRVWRTHRIWFATRWYNHNHNHGHIKYLFNQLSCACVFIFRWKWVKLWFWPQPAQTTLKSCKALAGFIYLCKNGRWWTSHSTWNFGTNWPITFFKNADFQSIFPRSACMSRNT